MADTKDKFDFSENPFVGPHPIETGRNIFGRNREIDDLYYLLSAERIVMLHSPSGAGKTSLIQAGLIPRLNERFDVWGPARVNQLPSANSSATVNRYIRSVVLGFEQQILAERRRTEDQIGEMTLAEYAASRREESKNIVLIFDQFEEILTAEPLAIEAKHEFFKQLGELLLNPRIWALFAMREDYLPALDPYAEQVPTHLKNWFRLDLLRRDEASEAIVKTSAEGRRQFADDDSGQPVVDKLVRDLSTMKVQQPDGTFIEQTGLYVEPLQLQVVCRRLWERMPADKQTIDLAEIEQSGDVTTALADYYATEVARLANGDVRVERKLREWVGERLITPDGIRSQVLRGAGKSEGLDNDLIASLVNTHLVRGEQREGATWYELAHDRLIEPIRNNNRDWFDTHLHKVQKLASLWEKEGRPDGLLLLGADLIEANQWAEQHEAFLTEAERRFLKASVAKQEAIKKEERQVKRLRHLLLALGVVVILALATSVIASQAYRTARAATEEAKKQELKALMAARDAEKQKDEAEKQSKIAIRQTELANSEKLRAEKEKVLSDFRHQLIIQRERGTNLQERGWGIVFTQETIDDKKALHKLLKHRRLQAQDKYLEMIYQPGENASVFLTRYGANTGPIEKLPYYILLVGNPNQIPFEFQYDLSTQHSVGRLSFDSAEEYSSYADSVLKAESPNFSVKPKAAFFAPRQRNDLVTRTMNTILMEPLVKSFKEDKLDWGTNEWEIEQFFENDATKDRLRKLLGDIGSPSLTFIAAHGIAWPVGDSRQIDYQGAILCSDYFGLGAGALQNKHYFAASDVVINSDLVGRIILEYVDYSAGSPSKSVFQVEPDRIRLLDRPMISKLSKRLLGHPNGGALALVGHVGETWDYSTRWQGKPAIGLFAAVLQRLMNGQTIGLAMESFKRRSAIVTAGGVEKMLPGLTSNEMRELAKEIIEIRNYIILGDPSVYIPFKGR